MNPFQEMFETNNPYKLICLVYSITILAAITPLLCLVIQFLNENPYTTLVQQVFSIIIGVTIATNILIHIPLILLYILGPFSQQTCDLIFIAHGSLAIQLLLLANILIISRYMFTFILKNPLAIQQNFWGLYIVLWTFLVGIFIQRSFFWLPGTNPNHFYICSGTMPLDYNSVNNKVNYAFFILTIFTILCNVVLGLKIKLYDWNKQSQNLLSPVIISENYDILSNAIQIIYVTERSLNDNGMLDFIEDFEILEKLVTYIDRVPYFH